MTPVTDRGSLLWWRNAVIVAFALGGITSATVGPRLPSLRADLGVGNGAIGALLAGVTVGAFAGLGCSAAILSWLGAPGALPDALWLIPPALPTLGLGPRHPHPPPPPP